MAQGSRGKENGKEKGKEGGKEGSNEQSNKVTNEKSNLENGSIGPGNPRFLNVKVQEEDIGSWDFRRTVGQALRASGIFGNRPGAPVPFLLELFLSHYEWLPLELLTAEGLKNWVALTSSPLLYQG